MKIIKFRMWDAFNKKFIHDWQDTIYIEEYCFDGSGDRLRFPFLPDQYTGLKNKKGVEIYLGDIVTGKFSRVKEVIFNQSEMKSSYALRASTGSLVDIGTDSFTHVEVIGNIYQNKELLNEKN